MDYKVSPLPDLTGRIFDIARFSVHDGPGIRTTVFLKGCPLRCIWCHNPEGIKQQVQLSYTVQKCLLCGDCVQDCPNQALSLHDTGIIIDRNRCQLCGECVDACPPQALRLYGRDISVDDLLKVVLADRAFYEQSGGGVTLSGGEPLLQPAFCAAFLQACHDNGLHTALDTSGAVPFAAFEKVLPHVDLFLYDLKHIDPDEHDNLTGRDNQDILSNLTRLGQLSVPLEVRIPCLPSINDGVVFEKMASFLRTIPSLLRVRLLPYHDLARSKFAAVGMIDSMPHIDMPNDETMRKLQVTAQRQGLTVVL